MALADCTKAQARLNEVSSQMETLAKTYIKGLMARALKSYLITYNAPSAYRDYREYYDDNGNLQKKRDLDLGSKQIVENYQEEGLPEWSRTYLHIAKYTPYNIASGLDNLIKDLLNWSGANEINKQGFTIADGTKITLTNDEITGGSSLGAAIAGFKSECVAFGNAKYGVGSFIGYGSDLFDDNPYGHGSGGGFYTNQIQIGISRALSNFRFTHLSMLGGMMAAGETAKAKLKKVAELYDELAACVEIPSCSNANPNQLVVFPFFPMLDSDGLPNNFDSTEDDGVTKDQDLQAIEDSKAILEARQQDISFEQDFFGKVLPFIELIQNGYNNAVNNFANSVVDYITGTLQQQSTTFARQNELAKFDEFLCGEFTAAENSFDNNRGRYDGNGKIRNVLQLALFGASGYLDGAADISVAKETSSIKNMKAQLRVLANRARSIVEESEKHVGFWTSDRFSLGDTVPGSYAVKGGILVSNTYLADIRRAVGKIIETGETNSERVKNGARRYALKAGESILSNPDFRGTIQSLLEEITDTIENLSNELKQISIDLAALPSKITRKKQEIVTRKLELANSELQRLYDESYKSCRAMAIVTLSFTSKLRTNLTGKIPEGENGTTVKHIFSDNPATDFETHEGNSGITKYKEFTFTTQRARAFAEQAAGIPLYDTGETYDLINQQQMLRFKKAGKIPNKIEGYLPNSCSVVLSFYHPFRPPEIELSSIIKQLYDANVLGGVFGEAYGNGGVKHVSGNKFKFTAFDKVDLTSCYSHDDFVNPYL